MNYQDFIKEASVYLTTEISKKADIVHENLLLMMKEFHLVCEKHEITYFMGFGTLLGARRDGGLIPWDFDVDLLVKYSDKAKLITALKESLPEEYGFICPETNSEYEHFDMRIYKKGVHHQILHVDIFYLLDAPDDKKEFAKYGKKLIRLSKIRYAKLTDTGVMAKGHHRTGLLKAILQKVRYCYVPVWWLNYKHRRLCEKYVNCGTHTYFRTCLHEKNLKYLYPKEWFSEAVAVPFNGFEFLAPKQTDEILTLFYKDYMRYPALHERFYELVERVRQHDFYCEQGLSDLW